MRRYINEYNYNMDLIEYCEIDLEDKPIQKMSKELFDLEKDLLYIILPKVKEYSRECNLISLYNYRDEHFAQISERFQRLYDYLNPINRKTITEMYEQTIIDRDISKKEQEDELQRRTEDTVNIVI